VWHTERFLGRFLLGLPLEELLYGWAAGAAAGALAPFAFGFGFAPRPAHEGAGAGLSRR
jgi:hypothetical protein